MTIEFHKKKQSPSLFQKQTVEFEVSYFLQWVDRRKIQHEPALLKQAVDDLIVRFAQQLNASFYRSAVKKALLHQFALVERSISIVSCAFALVFEKEKRKKNESRKKDVVVDCSQVCRFRFSAIRVNLVCVFFFYRGK